MVNCVSASAQHIEAPINTNHNLPVAETGFIVNIFFDIELSIWQIRE